MTPHRVALFRHHGWPADSALARIVEHDAQAVWTPAYTRAAGLSDTSGAKLWGRLGRKVDPTGVREDKRPIIDVNIVRTEVMRRLSQSGGTDPG